MNTEVFSRTKKTTDEWETPQYFFDILNKEFNFNLDPCSSDSNHKCYKYFTIEDNGLKKNWFLHTVFVNPPYSDVKEWSEKCYREGKKRNTKVVLLIPSRTDTRYWHDYIMKADEIRFCKGRINFLLNGIKPKNGSTFPSVVVIFDKCEGNPICKSMIHK